MARTAYKPETLKESAYAEEDREESEEISAEGEGKGGPDDVKILHVDDSSEFVEKASAHLRKVDGSLDIETEPDPVGALERLRGEDFDCVICDRSMPDTGMEGMWLCEEVRSEHPGLAFVFSTGISLSEFPEEITTDENTHMRKETGVAQHSNLASWITETV